MFTLANVYPITAREAWITYLYRSEDIQHGDVWVTEENEQFVTLGITAEGR